MIGVSCTCFCSKDFRTMWEAVSAEFSHWEIFSETEHAIQGVAPKLLSFADKGRMTYSLHSAISDTNAAALTDIMRKAAIEEFRSEMECAAAIGATPITVHAGLFSQSVKGINSRSLEKAKETMKALDRMSREYGVVLAIENMPSFAYMLGQKASELDEVVEGTDLGICFDIGHANTTGQIDEMIDTFRDRIVNIHIHDNMGDHDSHMTIGDGNIHFVRVLSRLKWYRGNYIIESKSLESAVVSRGRLERLLG